MQLKGNCIHDLQCLPNQYVIVDTETTGLDPRSKIIQIAALKIDNGNIVDRYSSLLRSVSHIPSSISKLTGITDDMLRTAPSPEKVMQEFIDFVGERCIVAHNAVFDMTKICSACTDYLNYTFRNDYFDTLYLARHVIADVENYKLATLCKVLEIENTQAHRADADCEALFGCFIKMIDMPELLNNCSKPSQIRHRHKNDSKKKVCNNALGDLSALLKDHKENGYPAKWLSYILSCWLDEYSEITEFPYYNKVYMTVSALLEDGEISKEEYKELFELIEHLYSPDSEIFNCTSDDIDTYNGKKICVTGEFKNIARARVESILLEYDATIQNNVTSKTDYLIVGSKGSAAWSCGNYGSKIQKAMDFIAKGHDVKIMDEDLFMESIKETGEYK